MTVASAVVMIMLAPVLSYDNAGAEGFPTPNSLREHLFIWLYVLSNYLLVVMVWPGMALLLLGVIPPRPLFLLSVPVASLGWVLLWDYYARRRARRFAGQKK